MRRRLPLIRRMLASLGCFLVLTGCPDSGSPPPEQFSPRSAKIDVISVEDNTDSWDGAGGEFSKETTLTDVIEDSPDVDANMTPDTINRVDDIVEAIDGHAADGGTSDTDAAIVPDATIGPLDSWDVAGSFDAVKRENSGEFTISAVWPPTFERGRSHPLVLTGNSLEDISLVSVGESETVFIDWDGRTLDDEGQVLRIPVNVEAGQAPGPLVFSISSDETSAEYVSEVILRPGEMQVMIGTLDLGETSIPTPWNESEFFQVVAVETGKNFLYFTDAGWNRIYATNLTLKPLPLLGEDRLPGIVYPIAGTGATGPSVDGPALEIPLSEPKGLCFTQSGDTPLLFLADTTHHQIRVMNLGDTPVMEQGMVVNPGEIVTIAGTGMFGFGGDDGPAIDAKFFRPWRIEGCRGPLLLTGDVENYRLRAINRTDESVLVGGALLAPGFIRTIAGTGILGFSGDGGPAEEANVSIPKGMVTLGTGLILFSDPENDRIRAFNPTDTSLSFNSTTIPPAAIESVGFPGMFNGIDSAPGFFHPTGLALDPTEAVWVSDTYSHTIKVLNGTDTPLYRAGQIALPGNHPTVAAGTEHFHAGTDGISWATEALMSSPFDVALDHERGELFIADEENRVVRRLKLWSMRPILEGRSGAFPDLSEVPGNQAILNADTGILSDIDGSWKFNIGVQNGVFDMTSVHIPAGESLRITGQTPACISATETILIEGSLLVEAGSIPVSASVKAEVGGSHGTPGAGQEIGSTYGSPSLEYLAGGTSGGGGAQGGGALLLVSNKTITITGDIYANGLTSPKNEGSGSGGAIKVVSTEAIECTGLVTAVGGGGLFHGGEGRIRLEAPTIDCSTSPIASEEAIPNLSILPGY